jgi:hypothetical protein
MAERLDRAIDRSSKTLKIIEHQPLKIIEQTPQATVQGPVPDRRFRRA